MRKALAALVRGHVDVYLTGRQTEGATRQVETDAALAAAYVEAARVIAESTGAANDLTVTKLMAMEGVTTVTEAAMDEEAVSALTAEAMQGAIAALDDMRLREGANLRADLSAHLDAAAALREKIIGYAPNVVGEYRVKLQERLAKMQVEAIEPARLAQEVALIADKCAIDEELSRLDSHIRQLRRYLDMPGETGKKMDFLIQEMNREANTIGSKCSDADIAQCVVDLKSEIEKLREQIQNAV